MKGSGVSCEQASVYKLGVKSVIIMPGNERSCQILRSDGKIFASKSNGYASRVNRVLDYVLGNLDQPLQLDIVAQVADFSPFHFHRIFQGMVGVTLSDFVKQRRLEKALSLMAYSKHLNLTEVALRCGFASSSDFSRCFKQWQGVPPSQFNLDTWRSTRQSQLWAAMQASDFYIASEIQPEPPQSPSFPVRIRSLPARHVAYIRVLNPYQGSGVVQATQRLMEWALLQGCADNQWLGYQWENPEITPLEECQYHIAVQTDTSQEDMGGEIGSYVFPPMQVAEVEVRGSIEDELQVFQWLYSRWLPSSGYTPDDYPCMEAYIGRPAAHGDSYFELHVHLPIRRER